ncbi:hypothetical protein KKC59_02635 [bacterium]|nr:hypothetical protein [bacterium]
MDISWWKSTLFFITISFVALLIHPSERELGRLFIESRMIEKAKQYIEEQFNKNTTDLNNAKRYLEILLVNGDFLMYEKIALKLLTLYPDDIALQLTVSKLYENNYDFEQAKKYWEKIVQLDPENTEVENKLLCYLIQHKEIDELIKVYQRKTNRLKPELKDFYELAELYSIKKDIPNVMNTYITLLKHFPEESKAQLRLATIYRLEENYQKQEDIYRHLLDKDAINNEYASFLLWASIKQKNYDRTYDLVCKLLEQFKNNDEFIYDIIIFHFSELKQKQKAYDMLNKLYEQYPDRHVLLKKLAMISLETNDTDKTISLLRSYHEKTGGDRNSHHILADLLAKIGDQSGSRQELSEALQLLRNERKRSRTFN